MASFGGKCPVSKANAPVHLKENVTCMNLEELECLPNETPACRKFLLRSLGWIRDGSRIGQVTCKPKKPRFGKAHFVLMKGYKYKPLVGFPEGFVDAFMRMEPSKDPKHVHGVRLRPLFAPDANQEGASREELQEMGMASKDEIREQGMGKPQLVIQFDMLSYYDQFGLSESVKRKLCFLGPDGIVYALERLPMGLRSACEVAQATTWFLLDFKKSPAVKVATCIDNIRFVGPEEEVVDAVRTFLDRCRKVGAQLDRWPKSDKKEDIVEMGERRGDFLGEHYDYEKGTRCLTGKTLKKLEMINSWMSEQKGERLVMTVRQFSVLMGLFFWTTSVLQMELSRFFHLLRDYRRAAALVANTQKYDHEVAILTPTAVNELKSWMAITIKNDPVPLRKAIFGEPSLTLVVDASGVGFCAISTTDYTDPKVLAGVWGKEQQEKAQSSVWAEPEAIFLACTRFVRPEDKFVRIHTDHSPVVYAAAAGYAKGFSANHLLARLKATFPNTMFEIVHVKGINNPADRYSRLGVEVGGPLNEVEKKQLAMLAAEMRGQGKDNVNVSFPVTAHKKRLSFMV
jgi:hypothetical protein